jgi:hypothetical protein
MRGEDEREPRTGRSVELGVEVSPPFATTRHCVTPAHARIVCHVAKYYDDALSRTFGALADPTHARSSRFALTLTLARGALDKLARRVEGHSSHEEET